MATNKEIIEKVNEAFGENDVEGFLNYCSDDIKWKMIGSPELKGKQAIRKAMESMEFVGLPKIAILNVIEEGNSVVAEGTVDMTKKSGDLYHGAFCDVYFLESGKIKEMHSYVQELASMEK
jgi:ketosteroid isomerase-like protein